MKSIVVLFLVLASPFVAAQPCPVSCPTLDDVAVQSLLDGGGLVQLQPRLYQTCNPLILPSNTHLRGTRGATVIRGGAGFTGIVVNGSYVQSLVAAVGADNVTVSDLTVDLFTCGAPANALSLLPAGVTGSQSYDGTVVTNATVESVEILGTPGIHSYMIWNLRGRHVRYLNNWIDGNSTAAGFSQEGMESYGGYDVLMSGNTVKNMGASCVIIGSGTGDIAATDLQGVRVVDNHLSGCTVGIYLASVGMSSGESNSHTKISRNVIVDSRQIGIDVPVFSGTIERDLQITDNTIRNVSASLGAGIRLWTVQGQSAGTFGVVGTVVEGNHIENISGSNSFGIMLHHYPNARILNNTIIGTSAESVFIQNSTNVDITGNRIEQAGGPGIGIYRQGAAENSISGFIIERNRISNWLGATTGILALGAHGGAIRDNVFQRTDTATTVPIYTDSSCGVTFGGNLAWYLPSWSEVSTPACP